MNETTVENMTTIGTVYESMMRNQRTYLANQDNKHRLEDECTDFSLNTSRNGVGEVSKRSRSKSKFSCKYGGARRDREPSRLQCKKIIKMFKKSKSSRKCIKRYIMYNTPYSSAMKNFLSIDFRIYLTTRLCRSRPVGRNTCSAYCCVTHHIYLVKTRTSKHKNMDVLLCVNDSCGLNNCYSIKCNKQQEKYCFSRANIFTSGDIELNPGPANAYMLLQSRLAQQGLSTLDVGGAGDCFFRAVSHQLYGEPSYHMNIRCVGVQYMRTNPERFIESIAGDSWARYLADMSQQGTWAEALVIQAVADAFHLTINIVETNERFAPHTVISPAAIPGHEPTVINIGHVDELHYVSTIPYNEEMVETNLSCGNQYAQVIGSETVANTLSQEDRIRAQKREWIRKERANKEFRD